MNRLVFCFAVSLLAGPVFGQTEVQLSRGSLQTDAPVGVNVVIETGVALSQTSLDLGGLVASIRAQLDESSIESLGRYESLDDPFLDVHVNVMDTGEDLIPFNVSLDYRQPVILDNQRRSLISASTWDDSVVGITPRNSSATIREAVTMLVALFAEDYVGTRGR